MIPLSFVHPVGISLEEGVDDHLRYVSALDFNGDMGSELVVFADFFND